MQKTQSSSLRAFLNILYILNVLLRAFADIFSSIFWSVLFSAGCQAGVVSLAEGYEVQTLRL